MLSMTRSKISSKKAYRATSTTLKSCTSVSTNPEISYLVDKLNALTEDLNEGYENPLNMIEWQMTKYRPNESENRIRIQNQIYLKKAGNETVRPRIKPIRRQSKSVELSPKDGHLSYKEHYSKLLDSFKNHKGNLDEVESEQDGFPLDATALTTQPSGPSSRNFKYYERLKKYTKLSSYIEKKIDDKKQHSKPKPKVNLFLSQRKIHNDSRNASIEKEKAEKRENTVSFGDEYSTFRVDSIVKKWKPSSKIERRFASTEQKRMPRKRLSSQKINKAEQLGLDTPRQMTSRVSISFDRCSKQRKFNNN